MLLHPVIACCPCHVPAASLSNPYSGNTPLKALWGALSPLLIPALLLQHIQSCTIAATYSMGGLVTVTFSLFIATLSCLLNSCTIAATYSVMHYCCNIFSDITLWSCVNWDNTWTFIVLGTQELLLMENAVHVSLEHTRLDQAGHHQDI